MLLNLFHCNSLFLNIDITQIKRIQTIQNALARAVTKTPKHYHKILSRSQKASMAQNTWTDRVYKAISLTYNTLQSSHHSYLHQLFTIQPSRSKRSSSALTLLNPSVTSPLKFADCSITMAVQPLWSKLLPALRQQSNPSYELTKIAPLAISPHSKLKHCSSIK